MRIVCPTCNSAYDVPANVVAARRILRCARCGAEFTAVSEDAPTSAPDVQATPPPADALPPPATGEPSAAAASPASSEIRVEAAERLAPPSNPPDDEMPPGRARKAAVAAAWVLSLVLVAAGAWAGIAERQSIMRAWPASTRIYAALGYRF